MTMNKHYQWYHNSMSVNRTNTNSFMVNVVSVHLFIKFTEHFHSVYTAEGTKWTPTMTAKCPTLHNRPLMDAGFLIKPSPVSILAQIQRDSWLILIFVYTVNPEIRIQSWRHSWAAFMAQRLHAELSALCSPLTPSAGSPWWWGNSNATESCLSVSAEGEQAQRLTTSIHDSSHRYPLPAKQYTAVCEHGQRHTEPLTCTAAGQT